MSFPVYTLAIVLIINLAFHLSIDDSQLRKHYVAGLNKKPRITNKVFGRVKSDFHLSIVCILGFVATGAVTPFLIYRALKEQWVIFFIDLAMIALTAGIAIYAWRSRKSESAAILMATTICCGFVLTAFKNSSVSPYWLYCIVLFSFSLVPPRQAVLLSLLGFCAVIIQPNTFAEPVQKLTFIATFFATTLFSFMFAKRNEYQRTALIKLAKTDVLTNIGNRRAFIEEFSIALAKTQRQHTATALTLFDIDHFKKINDNFGHDMGDDILIKITHLIKENLRPNDRVFRVGGEEFCLLIQNMDKKLVENNINRLRDTLANSPMITGQTVTLSAGITHINQNDTLEACLKRADDALYQAKNNGRNTVVYIAQ